MSSGELRIANPKIIKDYIKHGLNVMLIGAHGVGKTQILKQVTEELGYKMFDFNAALVDPYVDITGIPQTIGNDDNMQLVMVRKKELDEADVIFFDEINRANTNTLNAIMNLVNEKKINNEVLPNLKCVVAASNPQDDEETGSAYSVGFLDPAQQDRFDVTMTLSTKVDRDYLRKALGNEHVADALADWQHKLNFTSGGQKRAPYVSPRRVEKLGHLYLKIPKLQTIKDVLGFDAENLPTVKLHRNLQIAMSKDGSENTQSDNNGENIYEYWSTDGNVRQWVIDNWDILNDMTPEDIDSMINSLNDIVPDNERKQLFQNLQDELKSVISGKADYAKDKKKESSNWSHLYVKVAKQWMK